MDGQLLKVSREVGVEFDIWLFFIKLKGKYVLANYIKSWLIMTTRRSRTRLQKI